MAGMMVRAKETVAKVAAAVQARLEPVAPAPACRRAVLPYPEFASVPEKRSLLARPVELGCPAAAGCLPCLPYSLLESREAPPKAAQKMLTDHAKADRWGWLANPVLVSLPAAGQMTIPQDNQEGQVTARPWSTHRRAFPERGDDPPGGTAGRSLTDHCPNHFQGPAWDRQVARTQQQVGMAVAQRRHAPAVGMLQFRCASPSPEIHKARRQTQSRHTQVPPARGRPGLFARLKRSRSYSRQSA